ncbi:MAG: DUF1501 domain-containing protein, partial [Verrucomicrobia bacterium]|nr:DUF1501 domain-containing protein [Verrucomicrobiota bacterium]
MKTHELKTRREFLRTGLLGGSLSWTLPTFLSRTMESLHAQADGALVQGVTGRDGNILVVLQLAGGNDGLNTVIPIGNDEYRKARPTLGVAEASILKLDPATGLHPSLSGLASAYQEGNLAIVQGVGYPNPNRSHFRSTEIWATAVDSDKSSTTGWIGRYFDNACSGCDASVGIAMASQLPQSFAATTPKGVLYQGGGGAKKKTSKKKGVADADGPMMTMEDDEDGGEAGGSIGMLNGPGNLGHLSALDFLERTEMDAKVSQQEISKASAKAKNAVPYPGSRLGQNFAMVSRLIAGGMPTRIYYLSLGGFDTHTQQAGAHERLLKEMGDAVAAFLADLKAQGNLGRVTLMTFSEFGRRVKENASGGTDHGAAAPLFLAGG